MEKRLFYVLFCLILCITSLQAFALTNGWADVADTTGTPYNLTGGSAGATVTPTTATEFYNYANNSTTPYIIQISGRMDLSSLPYQTVRVRSNKTITGIGSNPEIYGHLDVKNASNVIISRLNINYNADEGHEDPWTDGITIQDGSNHVWVNHCNIYNSPDGLLDICGAADYVTVSWCKFYYTPDALNTTHHYTNLVGSSDTDYGDRGKLHVTFHHNWWADNCNSRMPRVRFGQVHVYNNYYSCTGNSYCIHPGVEAQLRIENNYFNNIAEPIEPAETGAIVYAYGNYMYGCTKVHSEIGFDAVFTPPYQYRLEYGPYLMSVVTAGAGAAGTELVPLSIPTGLTATATETSVILDWNNNPESGTKRYNVYRSTTPGSNYTKLTYVAVTTSAYTDTTVTYGTKYYYVVTSLSTASSESLYSSEVSAIPAIYGDFVINHSVDMNDVGYLSDFWLVDDCQQTADIDSDHNCMINFVEFGKMAENWLKQ
jgi:pectate lyase